MRSEWRAELLDRQDRLLGRRLRVRGGSLSWSIFSAVSGSGTLEITEPLDDLADPDAIRIRVEHVAIDDGDGTETVTPFGVWLPVVPGYDLDMSVGLARASVALLDKTELLNRATGSWGSASTTAPVTTQVRDMCTAVGEDVTAITDSDATLGTALVWEPEETWLQVANRLLGAIGYTSLEADLQGRLAASPYVEPGARPLVGTYGPEGLRVKASAQREVATYDVPNVVVVTVAATDEAPAIIGTARNDDPESPLSSVHRGERPLVESVEAASQEVADQIAARRLAEVSQVTDRITITHPVDGVQLNDRVEVGPLGAWGTVVSREVRLELGAVVSDTVRRIWTGGESWR